MGVPMKKWIYLSPHFDDVVLSVGGMIWEQAQGGEQVEIWTICAGDPPFGRQLTDYAQMMHILWELGDQVSLARSKEDAACCRSLGAGYRRYTVPDNIYRYIPGTDEAVVKVPDDNQGDLEPVETYLIPPVTDFLSKNMSEDCELIAPLAIGNHRDHVLTRKAAERLGVALWHYVDFPYVLQAEHNLADWIPASAQEYSLEISAAGLKAWQDGFACHRSQINMFWGDEGEMRAAIEDYFKAGNGSTLWRF